MIRPRPCGAIAANVYSNRLKVADISLEDDRNWAGKPGHVVWIGLHRPDAEALFNLQQQFDLHELAVQDALNTDTRTMLKTFGDALFMVLYSPLEHQWALQLVETLLFAGSAYIISTGYGEAGYFSRVRRDCEARPLLLRHGED